MAFIRDEDTIAVNAELARLQELARETGEDIETVAAMQVSLYRRSLHDTRQALADAVNAAHQAQVVTL